MGTLPFTDLPRGVIDAKCYTVICIVVFGFLNTDFRPGACSPGNRRQAMEPVRKILIILSTAEREKAMAGLMYAKNTHDNHWFDDVRVVLFGPFERLVAEDKEIRYLS